MDMESVQISQLLARTMTKRRTISGRLWDSLHCWRCRVCIASTFVKREHACHTSHFPNATKPAIPACECDVIALRTWLTRLGRWPRWCGISPGVNN